MTAARTLSTIGTFLVALVMATGSAQAQQDVDDESDVFDVGTPTDGEETREQDSDANVTTQDPPGETNEENDTGVDVDSPFDPEYGEEPIPNETAREDTPFVAAPLVVIGLAAILALARRRRA